MRKGYAYDRPQDTNCCYRAKTINNNNNHNKKNEQRKSGKESLSVQNIKIFKNKNVIINVIIGKQISIFWENNWMKMLHAVLSNVVDRIQLNIILYFVSIFIPFLNQDEWHFDCDEVRTISILNWISDHSLSDNFPYHPLSLCVFLIFQFLFF